MSLKLQVEMIVIAILLLVATITIVKKGRISIKYSMVWLFSGTLILVFALFPNMLKLFSNILGFETISNMVFLIMFGILFLITMSLTVIVSKQKEIIKVLVQELSNLKSEIKNENK